MKRSLFIQRRYFCVLIAVMCVVFTLAPSSRAQEKKKAWHVKGAAVRFKLSLASRPSTKSAGYFAKLPDGGILPSPPSVDVVDGNGNKIKSYVLWYNRIGGMGIVFEDAGSMGTVYAYISKGNPKLWNSKTGITPSPIVCANPKSGDMGAANALSKLGAVDASVHYKNASQVKTPKNCIAVTGDLSGRPAPCSFYFLSYINVGDLGKTWLAPQPGNGSKMNVRFNGKNLAMQQRTKKWGGTGQYVNLKKGTYQLEMLIASSAKVDFFKSGAGFLSWFPPDGTMDDYTKEKSSAIVMPSKLLVRSGKATVMETESSDGSPLASFALKAVETLWFEGVAGGPVFVYRLNVLGADEDTKYTWSFGDGATAEGPSVNWFFKRGKEHRVTLTATSGTKSSKAVKQFYGYSSLQSDMNSENTKENFRKAFLSVLKGYPEKTDPTAWWDAMMFKCFYEVQEFGKGNALLAEVMTKRWKYFSSKLNSAQTRKLEDMFYQFISYYDSDKAIAWLTKQIRETRDSTRKKELTVMMGEIHMYQKDDFAAAEKLIKPISTVYARGADLAAVRMGDIQYLKGDLNEATKIWGKIQDNAKAKDMIKTGSGITWAKRDERSITGEKIDKKKKKKKKQAEPEPAAAPKFVSAVSSRAKVDDWKKSSVLSSSTASAVITLMDQGFYMEALGELQRWERNFPLDKGSSDYILQEAKFYVKIGNRKRARVMLTAYCKNIDVSNYLADSASLLLDLMLKDKEVEKQETIDFCIDMKKRFKFHPMEAKLGRTLYSLGVRDSKILKTH